MMDKGTRLLYAATPAPASDKNTIRISSVAYAVDEMASLANTGSAIFLGKRWFASSADEIGLPMKNRLTALDLVDVAISVMKPATLDPPRASNSPTLFIYQGN
ncbi:MAG: hypothetical protein ABR77_06615 [Acidimicrobiia bacterium BACL6 MAG-120322-bin79]|nr:MAG: hypothetical protein ABR77_06615 [Acidimicrobiia bacterium BACL6 MAG-120322-bin79]